MMLKDEYHSASPPEGMKDEKYVPRIIAHPDHRLDSRGLSLRNIEEQLALYSHWCGEHIGRVYLQEELGRRRQQKAFQQCQHTEQTKGKSSYHDLANLYYALKRGEKTLGNPDGSSYYLQSLRELAATGEENPKVLLMGFSTNYSLENLAAILHLVGFPSSRIVALDASEEPLRAAQQAFGRSLYTSTIDYVQADARKSLTADDESYDAVVTHLFFTHIPSDDKRGVMQTAKRALKQGRDFVDEEIIIPGGVDLAKFVAYFGTLALAFLGPSSQRDDVRRWMRQFGSHPILAYSEEAKLTKDLVDTGFSRVAHSSTTTPVYEEGDRMVTIDMVNFIAKK